MRVITPTTGGIIKCWATGLEAGALAQAVNLTELPFVFKHVALMPDAHQGYGMPIGGVCATDGVIVPNMVGVDIGCGMAAIKTDIQGIDQEALKRIMGNVRKFVPVGFAHHQQAQEWDGFNRAPDIPIIQQELDSARKQLGTLGGGNHFIEFQEDSEKNLWVMTHSGSRNFGLKAATAYHKKAQELCARWHVQLPDKDLAFLPMDEPVGKEYFEAMSFCLEFAQANRYLMLDRIFGAISLEFGSPAVIDMVNIHHNYAALENHFGRNVWVHRKGATSARAGQLGIIPGSMGAASYIVKGLGNPESFQSCSHGAGRRMGRKEAARKLNLEEEQAKMSGIVHGLRNADDLDEAPGAYKPIDEVMANQTDLVSIEVALRPIGSIKG